MEKRDDQHIEGIGSETQSKSHDPENYVSSDSSGDQTSQLSNEHREYLIHRHGTADLDPIPDMSDADPYNWPTWKVRYFQTPNQPVQLTKYPENNQSRPRSLPRHDGHIHCILNPIRIRQHRRRPTRLRSTHKLSDLPGHRHSGWCAVILASIMQQLRSTTDFPSFVGL